MRAHPSTEHHRINKRRPDRAPALRQNTLKWTGLLTNSSYINDSLFTYLHISVSAASHTINGLAKNVTNRGVGGEGGGVSYSADFTGHSKRRPNRTRGYIRSGQVRSGGTKPKDSGAKPPQDDLNQTQTHDGIHCRSEVSCERSSADRYD